ncbi:MAG: iron-sulfur cluster assembly scaffold protein [Novosphingobium sp.]
MLALATSLADFPLSDDFPLQAAARSPACGSTLRIGLTRDPDGSIARVGLSTQACAIGQAAAALFVRSAAGKNAGDIDAALNDVERWLSGEGELPGWPGFAVLSAARDYPGRHGAILLAWRAARDALSSEPLDG